MREQLKDKVRLEHIIEAINHIEIASAGIIKEDLSQNFILRHALTWNIMIIGEAANRLSPDFCSAHAQTPWRDIAGMRNVLVHEYFNIDIDELWSVIKDDIPMLKGQILSYLDLWMR